MEWWGIRHAGVVPMLGLTEDCRRRVNAVICMLVFVVCMLLAWLSAHKFKRKTKNKTSSVCRGLLRMIKLLHRD